MQRDEVDLLIQQTLQTMIDTYPSPDSQEKWLDFEKRLSAQKKKVEAKPQRVTYKSKFIFVVAIIMVIFFTLSFNPYVVTGFKNEVFKWFNCTGSGDLVIAERHNPQYKLGIYEELSFNEAQDLVVFDLQYPHYLPEQFLSAPQVRVVSNDYPKSTVTITYNEGGASLIIKQENVLSIENLNTYVPQNAKVQKIIARDNLEVTLINQDSSYQVLWIENMIRVTVIAKNITEEEAIKIVEGLQ